MKSCGQCGADFEVDDARSEFDVEFDGDPTYDDIYEDGGVCGDCAIAETSSNIDHGAAIEMMNGEVSYDATHVDRYL